MKSLPYLCAVRVWRQVILMQGREHSDKRVLKRLGLT